MLLCRSAHNNIELQPHHSHTFVIFTRFFTKSPNLGLARSEYAYILCKNSAYPYQGLGFSHGYVTIFGDCEYGLISRIAKAATRIADRVIILMDADGKPHAEWTRHIESFLGGVDMNCIRIVLLDHEIEEWLCYSKGIKFDGKPSKILKDHLPSYTKNQLPKYASKLDCEKLKTCSSFKRLIVALGSDYGK